MNRIIKTLSIVFIVLTLSFSLQGCASANEKQRSSEDFQISFKLDSRLSGGSYGGERWVPPPYGPVAFSGTYTLEARTYYSDEYGRQVAISAEWIPEDPNLVVISPERGKQVSIMVHGVGETSVLVKISQGISKSLSIKTTAKNDAIQVVEISQCIIIDEKGTTC